jgi:hypothetical protein
MRQQLSLQPFAGEAEQTSEQQLSDLSLRDHGTLGTALTIRSPEPTDERLGERQLDSQVPTAPAEI